MDALELAKHADHLAVRLAKTGGNAEVTMTLLDFFAAEALKGILSSDRDHDGYETPEKRVGMAWKYANLMIQARSEQ